MTRAQQSISVGLLVTALYLACFYRLIPIFPAKVQDEIIPVLPFWALVSFGSYLLSQLGTGLLFFNDVPEAYKSLMGEIETARADLRSRGVEVD